MVKTALTAKREAIKSAIEQRGLLCVPYGKAWRVFGKGVDILTADLGYLDASQLCPFHSALQRQG